MIVPLSHERATVERLPWVTLSIIGLAVLVHLWSLGSQGAAGAEEARREAVEYLVRHPYLVPDPELVSPKEMDRAFGRERSAPAGAPVGLEQRRLDELTAAWEESRDRHPLRRGGLVPGELEAPNLVTHLFLHAGFLHLFFNLLFLYLTGPFVEEIWGPVGFAAFYLGGGVLAGGIYALQYPHLTVPLVGASGAVAAVMGAFLVFRGRLKIRFLVFLGIAVATFSAPAWLMLPLWFVFELLAALRSDVVSPDMGGEGVAYWAHVWGFTFGLVAATTSRRIFGVSSSEAPEEPDLEDEDPALAPIREDLRRGIHPRAWQQLEELLHRRPRHEPALELYWQLARRLERGREATEAGKTLARLALQRGETDRASAYLAGVDQDAEEHGTPDPEVEALRVRLAEARWREGNRDRAEEIVRELIVDGAPDRLPLGLQAKLARLAAEAKIGSASSDRMLEPPPPREESSEGGTVP